MKPSLEKPSDGDVLKDSLTSEDFILILKRYKENIEKKMKELHIATKNTIESQIKGELQLVSINKTINFISEKFDEFEKDRREKVEVSKYLSKKTSKMAQRIDKLENLVYRQEQNSRRNCLLVHKIVETNDENKDNLSLKTINEKLDVDITDNKVLQNWEEKGWIDAKSN